MSSDDSDQITAFRKRTKKINNNKRKRNPETGLGLKNVDQQNELDTQGQGLVTAWDLKKKSRSNPLKGSQRPSINLKTNEKQIVGVAYKESGTAQNISNDSATRTLDIDGYAQNIIAGDEAEKLGNLDGVYTGQGNYKEFVNKKKANVTQATAGGLRAGPLKGLSGVRISSRFDYAPAICKDYKETGFCGFGDSCVFMHDRGDYKMGWQLDKEWDDAQKKAAAEKSIETAEEVVNQVESDDDLPFACLICRILFTGPVITKCGHYFCEKCALVQFRKTPACFACNANTLGVFNVAPKGFMERVVKKKERMKLREEAIRQDQEIGNVDEKDNQN